MTTAARLLRLLTLLQTRRHWAGAALAERLEVHPRTLRRDVDRLRTLGYPVHASSGVAGGYALRPGAAMPPLLLDDDEALATAVALRSAATLGLGDGQGAEEAAAAGAAGDEDAGTAREEVALRALVKLEQVMPAALRARVQALRTVIAPMPMPGAAIDAGHLATLAVACRDQLALAFDYEDAQGRASAREVEPQGVVHTGTRWYLVAWDRRRSDWRTFRVDRIRGAPALGAHFAPRAGPASAEGGDLRAFVARSIAVAPYAEQARVLLHAPRARMAARIPPAAGVLSDAPGGRCLLECGAHAPDSLIYWLLVLDVEFDVLSPPALAERLRRAGERLARSVARVGTGDSGG